MAKFFTQTYDKDMLDRELSVKGWNWGTANFNGNSLAFEVGKADAFEIPLATVQQCTAGKNEVALEFHAVRYLKGILKGSKSSYDHISTLWPS